MKTYMIDKDGNKVELNQESADHLNGKFLDETLNTPIVKTETIDHINMDVVYRPVEVVYRDVCCDITVPKPLRAQREPWYMRLLKRDSMTDDTY